MSWARAALNHLFRREDIGDSDGGIYLERWTLLRAFGCALYLHRFERSDWSRDLHDHPRSFFTLPLRGGYWDETEDLARVGSQPRVRRLVRWPLPRFRRAEHRHRVQLDPRWPHPVTLVLMLTKRREWGFYTPRGFVQWERYTGLVVDAVLQGGAAHGETFKGIRSKVLSVPSVIDGVMCMERYERTTWKDGNGDTVFELRSIAVQGVHVCTRCGGHGTIPDGAQIAGVR